MAKKMILTEKDALSIFNLEIPFELAIHIYNNIVYVLMHEAEYRKETKTSKKALQALNMFKVYLQMLIESTTEKDEIDTENKIVN